MNAEGSASGGRRARTIVLVGAVLAAALGVAGRVAATSADRAGEAVLGPGPVTVEVRIEHSRFVPDVVRVRPDTAVTFRLRNGDPIGHELIVGGPEVHRRHESGTEASHPTVPGEVSVAPLGEATTTFTIPSGDGGPGTVLFACHLPGHFAYGMRGELRVG